MNHAYQNNTSSMLDVQQEQFGQPAHMSITKYEIPSRQMTKDFDLQSINSKKTDASKYKRYNLKDYQNLQSTLQQQKMGGLGANIGSDEWELARRKKEIQMQYANNLKHINTL
jgi:uncharacterized iron-regulated protein